MHFFNNIKNKINFKNITNNMHFHKKTMLFLLIASLIGSISIILSYSFFSSTSIKNIFSGIAGNIINPDLNINILLENTNASGVGNGTYTSSYTIPTKGYVYNATISSCTNGTLTNNVDGTYTIISNARTRCSIYYDADGTITTSSDVDLVIMKETTTRTCNINCGYEETTDLSIQGLINTGFAFNSTDSNCTNGNAINFDGISQKIVTLSGSKGTCTAYFYKAPKITEINDDPSAVSINGTLSVDLNGFTIDKYYFSIDGENYIESNTNNFLFENLTENTEYTVYAYVTTTIGRQSVIIKKDVRTFSAINLFAYTGSVQTMSIPANGYYQLQVWGAQGGYRSSSTYGGLGGYSIGTIYLTKNTNLFVYVGGSGNTGGTAGGFNGGGSRASYVGGGGASDIRIASDSLYARVIVAGGGGSDGKSSYAGTPGGGVDGIASSGGFGTNYGAGHQTYSGSSSSTTAASKGTSQYGGFGFGGYGAYYASGYGGAGGGGWYGGSGTYPDGSADDDRGGSGGSGYVYTSATATSYPTGCLLVSDYYLTSAITYAGNTSFVNTTGNANETGHAGNGYAKITYLGKTLS